MMVSLKSIKTPNTVLFCLDWGIIGVFEEKLGDNQLTKSIDLLKRNFSNPR